MRCKTHGLLNFDQIYFHNLKNNTKRIKCKKCTKSYINKKYDPEKQKTRNHNSALRNRGLVIKKAYGIDNSDYNKLLLDQDYSCAICKITIADYIKKHMTKKSFRKHFDIDHCHINGRIRGLLCRACNVGIGFLKSDPAIIQQASDYLITSLKRQQ